MLARLTLLATLVAAAQALPSLSTRAILPGSADYSNWQAPTPGDARSPCPALNSLANHGILPRNGRNISLPALTTALFSAFNVGPDFSLAIGGFGLDTNPTLLSTTLNLDNLQKHGVIEHDASLSRQDFHLGNNTLFNQTLFNTVLAATAGSKQFNISSAAAGKWARVLASSKANSQFTYTPKEFILAYGETALYLSVMGNPLTGTAPVSYVKIFFEQERLPHLEGWRPSLTQTSFVTLSALIDRLVLATPDQMTENVIVAESTVEAVFSGSEVMGLLPGMVSGIVGGV